MKKITIITTLLLCMCFLFSFAQKKVITTDDFSGWKTIEKPQITNNGKFFVYGLNPQKGDGMLIVKNLQASRTDTLKRGKEAKLSPNNDFIAYKIAQPLDTIRKAKLDKVKKDEMPKDSLGIFMLESGKTYKFANLKSFKIAEKESSLLAFLIEKELKQKKDTCKKEEENPEAEQRKEEKKKKGKKKVKELVLFPGLINDTVTFTDVDDYFIPKYGKKAGIVQKIENDSITCMSFHLYNVTAKTSTKLFEEEGTIMNLSASEQADKFAFLFSTDTIKEKTFSLYMVEENRPEQIVDTLTQGLTKGYAPSEFKKLNFSQNGQYLFFGAAPKPVVPPKDSIPEDEKPKLDIWSWTDIDLQPMQKVNLKKEKERTYLAVFHTKNQKVIQLADTEIKSAQTIDHGNGEIVLAWDDTPYRRATSWTGKWYNDYYFVNIDSGERTLITKNIPGISLSPKGKYAVWYQPADSCYYSKDLTSGEIYNLTTSIPVHFWNEWNDEPKDPGSYGIEGFDDNERYVFIKDRYDIWKIDLARKEAPVNITKGKGRNNKIRFNFLRLDKEKIGINLKEDIILSGINEESIEGGLFKTSFLKATEPKSLIFGAFRLENLTRAKDTNTYFWTKETIKEYPDVWVSKNFKQVEKVTDANPQQATYNWATVEVEKWTSFDGIELSGLLYKPENFDPDKTYPIIVYFYERSLNKKFNHYWPYPSRSTINRILYASNGYLVFIPDIVYKTGFPGQSAYNAIVSGTMHLANKYPFIDKGRMALQGQSWGGYQAAYLITQTNLYAAAMAGAVVSNMTSAYGGIRWESGMSRMFQYEHTQSRIGGTLWKKTMRYIDNSPLFYADKIETPLMMMHNDKDTAVPWYQGIEFFTALRRLDKPVWMLSYNDEPHNLKRKSWANRVDLTIRMMQFFDHYLKGKPAPQWMQEGIPAIKKGEELRYDR